MSDSGDLGRCHRTVRSSKAFADAKTSCFAQLPGDANNWAAHEVIFPPVKASAAGVVAVSPSANRRVSRMPSK